MKCQVEIGFELRTIKSDTKMNFHFSQKLMLLWNDEFNHNYYSNKKHWVFLSIETCWPNCCFPSFLWSLFFSFLQYYSRQCSQILLMCTVHMHCLYYWINLISFSSYIFFTLNQIFPLSLKIPIQSSKP